MSTRRPQCRQSGPGAKRAAVSKPLSGVNARVNAFINDPQTNNNMDTTSPFRPVTDIYSPQDLEQLCARIAASGELGRSRTYENLLHYLMQQSSLGRTPKEIEIAIEVLGRDAGFDVSRDSVVRVYIHQLRKKLDRFYARHQDDAFRICIPKGQYSVAALAQADAQAQALTETADLPVAAPRWRPSTRALLALVCLLLGVNLVWSVLRDASTPLPATATGAAQHAPWSALLDDALPVLVVMGDYYIFGERDAAGGITRMIRDFNVNSSDDLIDVFLREPGQISRYVDLDLNYMPEGSALALARIAPLLQQGGKQVDVTMMSRLNPADLRTHHVVYIGYLSALDTLSNMVFADSGLEIGSSYDQLVSRDTRHVYNSDAGLPSGTQPFRDFGFFSTFPGTAGNQIVVVAGTRDAGLMHTAQAVADGSSLAALEQDLRTHAGADSSAFEALYEVFGFERLNFDASLLQTRPLDPARIWGGDLSLPR